MIIVSNEPMQAIPEHAPAPDQRHAQDRTLAALRQRPCGPVAVEHRQQLDHRRGELVPRHLAPR